MNSSRIAHSQSILSDTPQSLRIEVSQKSRCPSCVHQKIRMTIQYLTSSTPRTAPKRNIAVNHGKEYFNFTVPLARADYWDPRIHSKKPVFRCGYMDTPGFKYGRVCCLTCLDRYYVESHPLEWNNSTLESPRHRYGFMCRRIQGDI
jgi:hypothetical protein